MESGESQTKVVVLVTNNCLMLGLFLFLKAITPLMLKVTNKNWPF